MLDVSATILDNSFKTSTPFIDTVFNETLWDFLPLGDYRSLYVMPVLRDYCSFDSVLLGNVVTQ